MNKQSTLRPEVKELMQYVGIQSWRNRIDLIASELQRDYDKAIMALVESDRCIPGLG